MEATRTRRTGMILVLILIIVATAGIGFILLQNIDASGLATEGPTPTPIPIATDIIVAARDIPRGMRLSMHDVTTILWPASVAMPLGALPIELSIGSPGLEQVEGRIARVDILSGQPILDHMLTSGGQWEDDDIASDSDFERLVRLQTELTKIREELAQAQARIKELEAELASQNSTASP